MPAGTNLSISDISRLYGMSAGAIRTALWRHRTQGNDPGIPLPFRMRGRCYWRIPEVKAHLALLREQGLPVGTLDPSVSATP